MSAIKKGGQVLVVATARGIMTGALAESAHFYFIGFLFVFGPSSLLLYFWCDKEVRFLRANRIWIILLDVEERS